MAGNWIDLKIEDHTPEVLKYLETEKDKILEEWGLAGVRFATEEINKVVYNTAPSPTYTRTGRLRGSLTYATAKGQSSPEPPAGGGDGMQKGQAEENAVVVGTNVEYAAYVEFGTSSSRPRPYLKPAIESHKSEFEKILKAYLTE